MRTTVATLGLLVGLGVLAPASTKADSTASYSASVKAFDQFMRGCGDDQCPTNKLIAFYNTTDAEGQYLTDMMLQGAIGGLLAGRAWDVALKQMVAWCPPTSPNSWSSWGGMMRLKAAVARYPDMAKAAFPVALLTALHDSYPCINGSAPR